MGDLSQRKRFFLLLPLSEKSDDDDYDDVDTPSPSPRGLEVLWFPLAVSLFSLRLSLYFLYFYYLEFLLLLPFLANFYDKSFYHDILIFL